MKHTVKDDSLRSAFQVKNAVQLVIGAVMMISAQSLSAATIAPSAYDMPNGEFGANPYFDETYNGAGNPAISLDPLSGGVGDLMDGVIATDRWSVAPLLYVGWKSIDPTLRFHFDQPAKIDQIDFYFDDTDGLGRVYAPSEITLSDGVTSTTYPVVDNVENGALRVSLSDLDLSGSYVDATIVRREDWIMLSEVQIAAQVVPEPSTLLGSIIAACCTLGLCRVRRTR